MECNFEFSNIVASSLFSIFRKMVITSWISNVDHQGIVRTKFITCAFVWWLKINSDIELYRNMCEGCALQQKNLMPIKLHPWDYPCIAWQRLHINSSFLTMELSVPPMNLYLIIELTVS